MNRRLTVFRGYGLWLLLLIIPIWLSASVSHLQLVWYDAARQNRPIPVQIHYPGTDSEPAEGLFPVLVIGHGFLMNMDDYQTLADSIAAAGFIVVLPNTETSAMPNHSDFAQDLAFSLEYMRELAKDSSSFWFEHIGSKSALGGHSMGGGCAYLAATLTDSAHALFSFSAANDLVPPASGVASEILLPNLLFSAEKDAVTPPQSQQLPIYTALASSCKSWINIFGGAHCYYADPDFWCDFGESTAGSQPEISRQIQQETVLHFLIPWLNWHLKEQSEQRERFEERMEESSAIEYLYQCEVLSVKRPVYDLEKLLIYPNPAKGAFQVYYGNQLIQLNQLAIYDLLGRVVGQERLFTRTLPPGLYLIRYQEDGKMIKGKFTIQQ